LKPVVLTSGALKVTLDTADGLPFAYTFVGETIWGEDAGVPAAAIFCRLKPWAYMTAALHVQNVKHTKGRAEFAFELLDAGKAAVSFTLQYAIEEAALTVGLTDVAEKPGYELIEVSLPNLATVHAGEANAWMAQGRHGGSFVRLAQARPYQFPDDEYFGRISTELPIGIVGKGRVACLMHVTAFMDGTETSIVDAGGELRARTGTVQVHRVHGGRCYGMNDGGKPVCGDANTPNLLVEQPPVCRMDFFASGAADAPWFPAVKLLRARMAPSPTDYFDDKLLYLIAGRNKTKAKPETTFAQSRQLITEVARLTDYAPQVALISGWVYDGQDTGYPSDDVVNGSLGTYEELMQLMQDMRRLHVNVSVNENFDDAYKSSPLFDTEIIAREPNGALWKSRAWDGEDSYIVGMAKYVEGGQAQRRIDATMKRYKLRDAMLIDALSWFAIRNDWDPAHPASGYRNLVKGKWAVLEEFRKRGVHIASEQFRYPMVGKLALSVDGPGPKPCPFGGEQIPLTGLVYRRSAIFGGPPGGGFPAKESLFWNSRSGLWFQNDTDRRSITDFHYLIALPYSKVHRLQAESYASRGTQRTILLEDRSEVTIDTAGPAYRVTWQGKTIATDKGTTCPVDASRIAFYSQQGGELRTPLPAGWNAADVTARRLTASGRSEFPVRVEGGEIVIQSPPRAPVMVYAAARAVAVVEG
jgi:hypothetical protein